MEGGGLFSKEWVACTDKGLEYVGGVCKELNISSQQDNITISIGWDFLTNQIVYSFPLDEI